MSLTSGGLCTFSEIWGSITLWTVTGRCGPIDRRHSQPTSCGCSATFYFIGGLFAWRALQKPIVPFMFAAIGALYGGIGGMLSALIIAGIYTSGPFCMGPTAVVLWGVGHALLFMILSFGRLRTY